MIQPVLIQPTTRHDAGQPVLRPVPLASPGPGKPDRAAFKARIAPLIVGPLRRLRFHVRNNY